ncbi:MAG: DUF3102 domain-containing protein [Treponema sp.]|jgi:hypothetical protein|nr:DUF3102 domain-containing protein [Treponema sp.]
MAGKFEGLLYIPASDLNFIHGIQRLKDAQLNAMLERLTELDETESGHKGRIKAVEKELKNRASTSAESRAVAIMTEDIQTAERLYGDGMPYEIDRIENQIRFYQDQAGSALLEMGKCLIRIKAHEEHGRFMKALGNVGLSHRGAEYAMAAARKFSNSQSIANLGSTKMMVLSILDEDDVKKLADGGDIAGMTLDDIDRMTTRELREKLREERDKHKRDIGTREKAIKQKEAKINELDEQLRYQQPPTKEQIAVAELSKLDSGYFTELTAAMAAMRKAVEILNQAQCVQGVNVQILNDWINKYNEEMVLLNGVYEELTATIDDLHPVTKGKYKSEEA